MLMVMTDVLLQFSYSVVHYICADATATPSSHASLKSKVDTLPFWCWFIPIVLAKKPLNKCVVPIKLLEVLKYVAIALFSVHTCICGGFVLILSVT